MTPFVKNGLTVLALIIIAAGGYYLFVLKSSSNLNDSVLLTSESKNASDRFLRELDKLRGIDLSGKIFEDNRFNSLVNFSQPLSPQLTGRSDPFQPIQ
jgi:hypothetical protein